MPLMVKVGIKLVVGKKVKNEPNTPHADQPQLNVKTQARVKRGVKQNKLYNEAK